MYILGLDISTKTGVAVIEMADYGLCDSNVVYTTLLTSKLKGFERVMDLQQQFSSCIAIYYIDFAIIEGFAFKNTYTLSLLTEITTAIKIVLHYKGTPFYIVAPKSLKKFITNNGNATKAQVIAALDTRYGITEPQDDIADALALAFMGATAYNYKALEPIERTPQLKALYSKMAKGK